MSGFSNHLAQAAINHFFRNSSQTPPATHYLGLCISDPTDVTATALSNEISAGWYARQAIAFEAPSSTTDVTTANTAQITFPAVTTSSVTTTHWAIFNASTSGQLLASGAWTASKTLDVGDICVIEAAGLVLTFD